MNTDQNKGETMNDIIRTNRITKATIVACDILGTNEWAVCCDTHGASADMPNKTVAISWMAEPWVFCEGCDDIKKASK